MTCRRSSRHAATARRGSASPDVLDEPVGRAQAGQPRLRIGLGRGRPLPEDVQQRPAHPGGDRRGVAAHEDDGAVLQQVPHLVGAVEQRFLHVPGGPARIAGERVLHPDQVLLLVVAQLVGVELVGQRGAAAEEQQRPRGGQALFPLGRALLEEAAEGSQAGAGADHDHRDVGGLRWPELDGRLADEDEHRAVLRQLRQVAGGDPGEAPGAGAGRPADHAGGDAADLRAGQGRGGDGVVAGAQRRQHVEVLLERQPAGGELVEQVEHRPVGREHLLPVAGLGLRVLAGERLQRGLLLRVVGVAGQDLDVVAARDVLQFHAAGQDAQQRSRLVDRQVGVRAAVRDDGEVLPGVEPEPGDRPPDEVDAVARQHAQVVTGPVGHVLGQGDLDVAGRSIRRAAGSGGEQLAVRPDPGGTGAVGHDHRVGDLPVGHRDRQPGAGGRRGGHVGGQAQCGGHVRPQVTVPGTVGRVEVIGGVALAAGMQPPAAVGLELLVEHGRHRLVGAGPLGVAAAEHRVGDPAGGLRWGAGDPPAEGGGVVRRRPVVRRADDHRRAVPGQVVDVLVQRAEGDVEAALGALLGEPGGDRLRRPQVRTEQHRQPPTVRGHRRHRLGAGCGDGRLGLRRRDRGPDDHVRPRPDLDEEAHRA